MTNPVCPQCQSILPNDDINVSKGIALCRRCSLVIDLAELAQNIPLDPEVDLQRPPRGAWYQSTSLRTVIGASHRSTLTALATFGFAAFWNGIVSVFVAVAISASCRLMDIPVPDWFPAPKMNGDEMGAGMTVFLWLFLTPFMIIGAALFGAFFMALAGRTEVRIYPGSAEVFRGVWFFGKVIRFDPGHVQNVRLMQTNSRDSDGDASRDTSIVIDLHEAESVKFGASLSAERRKFVASALRKICGKY